MTTTNPTIYSAPVLAGAYRGKSVSERTLLTHAVADGAITIGRTSRAAGEALCSRAANVTDDSCSWEGAELVTCPKCLAVLARLAK